MVATRTRVRILHLSDLHERAGREKEAWRRRRVLGPAWEDNLAEILQDGPIDLVCFTGDAADWGKPEEFAAAADFLRALLNRLRLDKERLFVVPGNHDVDQGIAANSWAKVREAAGQVEPLDLARWLHDLATPFGFDAAWREAIFNRLSAYRSWVRNDLGRPELIRDDKMGGPHSYRQEIAIRGACIQVVGLDSAWLCGDRHDNGKLRVSDEQVMRHLARDNAPLPGFRLVLIHHPLDDLADTDRERVRRCLADHADLVLRGHLHSPETALWSDPDRSLRHLAAGCLYEGHRADQYPNGCQVLTLDLGGDGQSHDTEVRLRTFSPRGGHYFDDDGVYRGSSRGRLRFAIGGKLPAFSASANPFDPYNPAVPPRFCGREVELRRLEKSFEHGHGVSIVGDWRIGKTSLLRTWELKLPGLGRKAVFLDGQGSEGASIAKFTAKILGRPASDSADEAADAIGAWAAALCPAPVLLIDEFDSLAPRFEPRFFERLREMLGRVILAVASRQPVDLLYKKIGRTSPFANRLEIVHLGLLDPKGAEQIGALSPDLDGEDLVLLRTWAGRHCLGSQLPWTGMAGFCVTPG